MHIDHSWLLANVPFVSFVCDNDALYSMRFLSAGSEGLFGYAPEDFIDNRRFFAASTTCPEDLDIVDAHAEQAIAGGSPVVSRYRLVQASGELLQVLLVAKAVHDENGESQALAGVVVDLSRFPALQGPPGLLSTLRPPARRRPPASRPAEIDAGWAALQLPVNAFFVRNDENYSACASCGSTEELIGYSAEDFKNSHKYKAASAAYPPDLDVADAYIEAAAAREGALTAARLRLVNSEGELVPVLVFARGAQPPGFPEIGVAGATLDISHIPALWGPFSVLPNQQ